MTTTTKSGKTPAAKATATKAAAPKAAAKAPAARKASAPKATSPKATAPEATASQGAGGTKADPWKLTTPPGTAEFEAYRDDEADPPALVVQVGKTQLRYAIACLDDLHAMLVKHGDWMPLGGADEQKPAAEGTVEAWGRSATNPVKGFYGLKKGLRGRFGVYVPPVLERLGLAEVEHLPKNNRMRAIARKK